MLNYNELSDIDFEYLCQDIMAKKLGVCLRRFTSGKDGGIDLTDNLETKGIVVQVKHYIKTSVSGLISSLKKEVAKVKDIKPEQYYICCSKELTAENIKDIYKLFENYMESDKNIITLIEIDDFLQQEHNSDIVKKHCKLWLCSENVLNIISNKSISDDSEMLIEDAKVQSQFFVQTEFYNQATEMLTQKRCLFLIGAPGVGKTITSKMLAMYFASQGYLIRYTTNVIDLSEIKKALSSDRKQKEFVLLDDCLGQCYFNLKESQDKELLSLVRYVQLSVNKVLLLNSRVTIFNEAQRKSLDFINAVEDQKFRVRVLDMTKISLLEKARILYNHLYFNNVPAEYMKSIKNNRNYMQIINHKNYNPRVVEYVSKKTIIKILLIKI